MAGKINILHAAKYYPPQVFGGIETAVQAMCRGCMDKDVKIDLLVSQLKGRRSIEHTDGAVLYRAACAGKAASTPVSPDYIRLFRALSRKADIVQIHTPDPLADLALEMSGYTGKVIVSWHSDIVRQKHLKKLYGPMQRKMLERADRIICASEGVLNNSEDLAPFMDKCVIIPYSVPEDTWNRSTAYLAEKNKSREGRTLPGKGTVTGGNGASDNASGTDSVTAGDNVPDGSSGTASYMAPRKVSCEKDGRPIRLLFVGRLVYYKGCSFLIEALGKLKSHAEVRIIGTGPLEEDLKRQAREQGVSDRIEWTGMASPGMLEESYEWCDVFVFPSVEKSEAYGIVQMEAMAYGKPVINTWLQSGVPYVSRDGETGMTVEPGDPDALAAAIDTLAKDRDLRMKYGMAARKKCAEDYRQEVMAGRLYELYKDVLSE